MSEIKGQLLGIILTVSIFGIVAAAMATAFTTASKSIGDKVTSAASAEVKAASSSKVVVSENEKPYKLVY